MADASVSVRPSAAPLRSATALLVSDRHDSREGEVELHWHGNRLETVLNQTVVATFPLSHIRYTRHEDAPRLSIDGQSGAPPMILHFSSMEERETWVRTLMDAPITFGELWKLQDFRVTLAVTCFALALGIISALVYTAAARNLYVAGFFYQLAFVAGQHGPLIFPGAFRSRFLTLAFLGACAMCLYAFMIGRYLQLDAGLTPNSPPLVKLSSAEHMLFPFVFYTIPALVFYHFGYGFGRGITEVRKPLPRPTTGYCHKDMRSTGLFFSGFFAIIVPTTELVVGIVNTSAFQNGALVFYLFFVLLSCACIFMSRSYEQEYFLPYMILYQTIMGFALFVLGRITSALITILRSATGASFDVYLPLIFLIYKLMFMAVYPLFGAVTLRMGRYIDQLQFMYPLQAADALILDGFSIFATDITEFYSVFVILRVVFTVCYQSGVFRWVSDRIGLTERTQQLLFLPENVVAPEISHSPESEAPPPRTPSGDDAPVPIAVPMDSAEDGHHVGRNAGDVSNAVALRTRDMRRTYNGSAFAQWLFFLQGAQAGLLSVGMLALIASTDRGLGGSCWIMCSGFSLAVVNKRAAVSFAAWLFTTAVVFYILHRKMLRAGFTSRELAALTAKHYLRAWRGFALLPLPVIIYFMTVTSASIVDVNGLKVVFAPD